MDAPESLVVPGRDLARRRQAAHQGDAVAPAADPVRAETERHAEGVAASKRRAAAAVFDLAGAFEHDTDPITGRNIVGRVGREVYPRGAEKFRELVADERRLALALGIDSPDETGDDLFARVSMSIHSVDRDVPAEAEVRRLRRDRKAGVLDEDREVGRLLHFDHEHAGADRVRQRRWYQHDVAGTDRELVRRRGDRADVLLRRPLQELRAGDLVLEAHLRIRFLGAGAARRDDDPGLGFAEHRAEVASREVARRMAMHRQADGGIEQLHQQPGRRAVAAHHVASDDLLGPFAKEIAKESLPTIDTHSREPFRRRAIRAAERGDGSDPVLRVEVVLSILHAAQLIDECAALVEEPHSVRCERYRRAQTHHSRFASASWRSSAMRSAASCSSGRGRGSNRRDGAGASAGRAPSMTHCAWRAAPEAAASTIAGRTTGRSNTSAHSCAHASDDAPPPTSVTSAGATSVRRSASSAYARPNVTPSTTARTIDSRP